MAVHIKLENLKQGHLECDDNNEPQQLDEYTVSVLYKERLRLLRSLKLHLEPGTRIAPSNFAQMLENNGRTFNFANLSAKQQNKIFILQKIDFALLKHDLSEYCIKDVHGTLTAPPDRHKDHANFNTAVQGIDETLHTLNLMRRYYRISDSPEPRGINSAQILGKQLFEKITAATNEGELVEESSTIEQSIMADPNLYSANPFDYGRAETALVQSVTAFFKIFQMWPVNVVRDYILLRLEAFMLSVFPGFFYSACGMGAKAVAYALNIFGIAAQNLHEVADENLEYGEDLDGTMAFLHRVLFATIHLVVGACLQLLGYFGFNTARSKNFNYQQVAELLDLDEIIINLDNSVLLKMLRMAFFGYLCLAIMSVPLPAALANNVTFMRCLNYAMRAVKYLPPLPTFIITPLAAMSTLCLQMLNYLPWLARYAPNIVFQPLHTLFVAGLQSIVHVAAAVGNMVRMDLPSANVRFNKLVATCQMAVLTVFSDLFQNALDPIQAILPAQPTASEAAVINRQIDIRVQTAKEQQARQQQANNQQHGSSAPAVAAPPPPPPAPRRGRPMLTSAALAGIGAPAAAAGARPPVRLIGVPAPRRFDM